MSYDIMFQQALTLHQQGQLDAAEQIYRQILETAPDHPDILNMLGLIAQAKGVHNQAIELFYKAIQKAPKHSPFYFNLGISLKESGKPIEALENLQKASELDPDTKEIYTEIGIIERSLNHIPEAQQAFLKALQIDADDSEAKSHLAMTYLMTDRNKAVAFLSEIAAQYPNEVLAPYFLSTLYYDTDNFQDAYNQAKRAEEIAPRSSEIKLMLGLAELRLKHPDDAEAWFAQAVDLDRNNIDALINLGNMETNRKDFENAEKHYKRAIELDKNNFNARLNYANMLYFAARLSEALDEYRAAIIINPQSAEACNNIGIILKDLREYEEALGLFFNAYSINPKYEEFSINIAETLTLLHRQDQDTATKIAENWLKISPDDVFARQVNAAFKGEKLEDTKVYSEKLFDNFADNYELVLEKIAYNLPERIRELAGDVKGTVVDLGCGSGLVGKALKTPQNQIIGIDISKKMLENAAKKRVYSKLIKADILQYSANSLAALTPTLVVAADVFGYIGSLEPILAALKGQNICFSIETLTEDGDYKLNDAGRYRHNPQYVENLLQQNGFTQINKYEAVLRKEGDNDVNGLLYFAK